MLSWKKALLTEKRVFGVAEGISSNLSRKYFKIFEKFPLKCPQQTGFFVRLQTVELQIWPILWHWSFSIHPENIRKPEVFLWFIWIWKETCDMKSVKKKRKKKKESTPSVFLGIFRNFQPMCWIFDPFLTNTA